MLAYLLAAVVVLIAALLAFGLAALLHLQGMAYVIFVVLILVLGIAAAVTIIVLHLRAKKQREQDGLVDGTESTGDLDLLLNEANRKLRGSQQGPKSLEGLPLIYILGESGSAKTTTIMRSGLDPELVAGSASHEGDQVPTEVLNIWFTRMAGLVEVGTSVRQNSSMLGRLVNRTRAKAYRSAFGTGAAPRAVIVCLSLDQLSSGGEPLMSSARATGAQLREISRLLGMPVPVYVVVTKLDRVPHFENYVRNLSDEEVRQVLGASLPRSEASAGTYADQATKALGGVIDGIVYKLGEFRVEMLDRENDARNWGGVYEFPREFGKLRKGLNQYLVELCKPSQLSANPYLRGFYFTGIRARMMERAVTAPAAQEAPPIQDAGATQYLNISRVRAESTRSAPVMVSSRVPQWTFLPRLLPEVILGDRSALSATKQSAPARLFRRILFGTLAFLFALYIIFLLVSYSNNAALEKRIVTAAKAMQSGTDSLPGLVEMRALEDLRQTIVQLDDYKANGAPLSYRFGLYQGNKLDERARRVYWDRFRTMMLNPAQANFVTYMRALPDAPATSSDFSSYLAAYNPLKAYLITTSNSDKSQTKFLTPVFVQYWVGTRSVDPEQQQLAQKQIDFYGSELLRQPPYVIASDTGVVEHTRGYLSKFLAETRVYQAMLTDADKTSAPVDFTKQYPDAAKFVSAPHVVRGAFTKAGFGFMQDALQHPDRYAQGETWVLGTQAGASLNTTTIGQNLTAQYSSDFLKEWHTFLTTAHVAPCGGVHDAPKLLDALAGPGSPILELFFVVSHNTAVNDQKIKSTFQPAQILVDPNATDRLIGGGNQAYVTALGQLSLALESAAANPGILTDPAVFAPVAQQVTAAKGAVVQSSQAFNVDRDMGTEKTVAALMQSPIDCVDRLAPSPGAPANGGGGKICSAISPLLGKFPFTANPNTTAQAGLAEVDGAFAPESGALWANYKASLDKVLALQGTQYAAAPGAPGAVNPKFLAYFNRAARVSSALYPAGQKSATFTFSLRFIPGNGVSSATLVVDGQRIGSGATTQLFTWTGATAQKTTLIYDNNEAFSFQGTWSLFEMVRNAKITRAPGGYRLDYPISTVVAGHITATGKIATFELSGPGADLLAGDGFSGLGCAQPVIFK